MDKPGWDNQFRETEEEKNSRLRLRRLMTGKENQYEFECMVCHKHSLGHKGRCVCDECKGET